MRLFYFFPAVLRTLERPLTGGWRRAARTCACARVYPGAGPPFMGGTLAWTITIGLRNFETSADFPVHGDSVCQQQPQPVSRSAKDSRQRVPSAERILAFLIDQGIFQKIHLQSGVKKKIIVRQSRISAPAPAQSASSNGLLRRTSRSP